MNSSYQDIKDKTIKWCKSLYDNGVYTEQKYNNCVKNFVDLGIGELPNEMNSWFNYKGLTYIFY